MPGRFETCFLQLLNKRQGLVANREFYLADKTFSEQNSERLNTILEELKKVHEWAAKNPKEVA